MHTPNYSLIPQSVYIHIPWCLKKCPYCDFNSHAKDESFDEAEYVSALRRDIEFSVGDAHTTPISSIFFGGGTPSLFSAASIATLLKELRHHLTFTPDIEITLEANPGSFEAEKFRDYRAVGINRLSLGVQSFNDDALKRLGRVHDAAQARLAIATALTLGFNSINVDLMFGLPQQSVVEALTDLDYALALGPTHISWYQLTLEPNTYFHRHPPALPEEEVLYHMQTEGQKLLAAAGFAQYEVSAYARAGYECRHNLNYWSFGDYFGFGAGAHGKLSGSAPLTIQRTRKVKHPRDFVRHAGTAQGTAFEDIASPKQRIFEFLLNGLRLNTGINLDDFTPRTGLPVQLLLQHSQNALSKGLLAQDSGRLYPTELGKRFLNDTVELFLDD